MPIELTTERTCYCCGQFRPVEWQTEVTDAYGTTRRIYLCGPCMRVAHLNPEHHPEEEPTNATT